MKKVPPLLFLLLCGACNGDEPPCDAAQWSCDDEVQMFSQAQCEGDVAQSLPVELDAQVQESTVNITVRHYPARCSQELCAYSHEKGRVIEVLIQPCDLHPDSVAKCSCNYDLSISLALAPGEHEVAVYRRQDEYTGSTSPKRIGTVPISR